MKNLNYLNEYRVDLFGDGYLGDEHNGAFIFKLESSNLDFKVIAGNGEGWDHVSVSTDFRIPRWNEMQKIKEMFFEDDEVVMQLHPAKKDQINNHPYCLHLWKPQNRKIPKPPLFMV